MVEDYGAGVDAPAQRRITARNLAFITGAADRLDGFPAEHDKYYGVAFELPLLLLERGVGLEDSRRIYLLRHLVTHAFFLVGGWCCSLLVYRLTRSRTVALFAFLLFVLQPRLYAHSFFNSKDLPFLSMFMVTLYVTHRAFRRDTVGAFVLCGVCVGVLTNLRIMGMMLYPAVLALRGLDLGQAGKGGGGRTHVLMTGTMFAVVGPGTLYALSPYLWTDPFEFVMAQQVLAHHPARFHELFQGRLVDSYHLPWDYIPTWVAISTPLVTLLCGVLGVLKIGIGSVLHPRAALGNTDLRFGLLLVACVTLPVVAIIALGSHLYNGWHHVFFLHAPLCGLAGLGVHWAASGSRAAAGGVSALAGVGVLVTGVDMVRLHPHQQVYFNALVDRTTPEYLRTHYVLDPWKVSCREGLEFLRKRYPTTTLYVQYSWPVNLAWWTLPQADRARLVLVKDFAAADVRVSCGKQLQQRSHLLFEHALYTRTVYNNTLLRVMARVTVPDARRIRARRFSNTDNYRTITAGRLVQQAEFALYTYPARHILGYAKDQCRAADVQGWFFVEVFPVDERDLPAQRRREGYDRLDVTFSRWGKQAGGKCWMTVPLPAYAIARIRTGQYLRTERLWETELVGPLP